MDSYDPDRPVHDTLAHWAERYLLVPIYPREPIFSAPGLEPNLFDYHGRLAKRFWGSALLRVPELTDIPRLVAVRDTAGPPPARVYPNVFRARCRPCGRRYGLARVTFLLNCPSVDKTLGAYHRYPYSGYEATDGADRTQDTTL
jgi:hypothetical protein